MYYEEEGFLKTEKQQIKDPGTNLTHFKEKDSDQWTTLGLQHSLRDGRAAPGGRGSLRSLPQLLLYSHQASIPPFPWCVDHFQKRWHMNARCLIYHARGGALLPGDDLRDSTADKRWLLS